VTVSLRQHLAGCFTDTHGARTLDALAVSDAALEKACRKVGEHPFLVKWAAAACAAEYHLDPCATHLLGEITDDHDLYTDADATFISMIARLLADRDLTTVRRARSIWAEREAFCQAWSPNLLGHAQYMTALVCVLLACYDDETVAAFRPVWLLIPDRAYMFVGLVDGWRENGEPERLAAAIQDFLNLGVPGLRVAQAWLVCDEDGGPFDLVGEFEHWADQLADDPDLVEYAIALASGEFDDDLAHLIEVARLLREPVVSN